MGSRRRLLLAGVVAIGGVLLLLLTLPITLTPSVRHRLLAALNDRFDSHVELANLKVSILPRVRIIGDGLLLRHEGRTDVPPLIDIDSFYAEASLFGLLGRTLRLSRVHLQGLNINIPPGGLHVGKGDKDGQDKDDKGDAAAAAAPSSSGTRSPLIVDEIISERAELRILRRDPAKPPRVFAIHHLVMHGVGADSPWDYRATLRNPTPPGDIDTHGTFGPWSADEPAKTPLQGEYTFRRADLGVFDGISGILSSEGTFSGVLERIDVSGRTTTPDFALEIGKHPVQLDTQFQATVDATNGNTWLKPVHATFRQTKIDAHGGVVETDGVKGRTVSLDVVMKDARIEDVLYLAIKAATPPMRGKLELTTKFLLPPGKVDTIEKLELDGSFHIASAHFAGGGVQIRIDELSRRARGEMDEATRRVASDLRGRFIMKHGTIRFPSITFGVPGARIALAGTYTLRSEQLDFTGSATLDAKLSEMTTGFKSVLLKAVDPFFRRKGNTVIPLTIGGTVDDPKFGLDIKRALTRQ